MPRAKYTKRPDGRYKTKVYIGIEDGKPKYKYVYAATVAELEKKAEELRYTLHKGADIMSGDLTFSVWADRFLRLKKTKVAEAYYAGIEGRVEFWKKAIGEHPISRITRSDLQVPFDTLAKKNPHTKRPTSKKTLIDYRMTAAGVFELAISDRAITYNPAKYLQITGTAEKKERRALTDEEQQWILNTPHRAQTAAMIMMLAGLRRGELIPLQIADIDLAAGIIRVNKSVKMVNSKPVVKKGGKTSAATRTVNIPKVLIEYLRPVLRGRSPFDLVCADTRGKMFSEATFRRMWESYLKELNFVNGKFTTPPKSKFQPQGVPMVIPHITPHMLRHTCTTNLILAGVDPITVKNQLGHADISTTLNIYTHVTEAHKETEIQKLDLFLAKKSV